MRSVVRAMRVPSPRGASSPFDAIEHLMNLAVQTEFRARLVEELTDLARRQFARQPLLGVESCRRAEPTNARPRRMELGDCFGDVGRIDADFGRDFVDLGQGALDATSVGAFLQLGGALENERHLLL